MQLENLVFQVDSTQVVQAAENLGKLALAIQDVEKPVNALSSASKEVNFTVVKMNKVLEEIAPTQEKAGERIDKTTRTLQKQQLVMAMLNKEGVNIAGEMVNITQALTRGQANMLAAFKLDGADVNQFKELLSIFQQLNATSGINTFDKVSSRYVS